MALMALDISTRTGWAYWRDGMPRPHFGTFVSDAPLGERATLYRRWIVQTLKDQAVSDVFVEGVVPVSGPTNLDVMLWQYGAHVITRQVCHALGIPVEPIGVGTWRSFYIGTSRAPKVDANGTPLNTPSRRRTWLKRAAIAKSKSLGWMVNDDNQADALGVLFYARHIRDPRYGEGEAA